MAALSTAERAAMEQILRASSLLEMQAVLRAHLGSAAVQQMGYGAILRTFCLSIKDIAIEARMS
jgi:hypothetical protein